MKKVNRKKVKTLPKKVEPEKLSKGKKREAPVINEEERLQGLRNGKKKGKKREDPVINEEERLQGLRDGQDPGFYEGQRLRGLRHGQGAYYFPNGARYVGEWERGLKHGIGKFTYPDGSSYAGEWWRNQRHGHGRYTYPNGDTYDGMWRLDVRYGHGRYHEVAAHAYHEGYFRNRKLQGPVKVLANNVLFTADYEDGKPNGNGVYTFPNGLEITGTFRLHGPKKVPLWVTKSIKTRN